METQSHPAAIPLCPLVGRDAELQALVQLWRSSRLVTLFGQSGVGKSALARAAAASLAKDRTARIHRLEAGRAATGAALLRLLARFRRTTADARTFSGPQLPEGRGDPPPVFLLLDDLPTGARGATHGLLQWLVVNPTVHLLVVTRRPLDLLGERTMPLAPLAVSGADEVSSPAAALFEFYAQLASAGGRGVEPADVAAISRALDGLPAALEAAAVLHGTLPDREILRIAREEPLSLSLRGRSLRDILAASWNDLPAEAREYLAANTGWPAPFSDDAATYLIGRELDASAVPHLLQLGLLRLSGSESSPRCRISPLMRAWIFRAGLASAPAQQERQARYLLGLAERVSAARGSEKIAGDELQSIRWAWRWLAGRREGEAVERFARALSGPLRHRMGQPLEARELLSSALDWARATGGGSAGLNESMLAAAEGSLGDLDTAEARLRRLLDAELTPQVKAGSQLRLASVLAQRGRLSASVDLRRTAIASLRADPATQGDAGVASSLGWALWGLSEDLRRLGKSEPAWVALEESGRFFESGGCDSGRAAHLVRRAVMHLDRGETAEASAYAREGQLLAERIDDRPGLARALQVHALTMGRDDPSHGIVLAERAICMGEEMSRPADLAGALLALAELAPSIDRPVERAMTAARRALQLARHHGFAALESAALLSLAAAYQHAGYPDHASNYAHEARSASEQTDDLLVRQRCEQWEARGGREEGGTGRGGDEERGRRQVGPDSGEVGSDSSSDGTSPRRPVAPSPRLPASPSPRPAAAGPPLLVRLLGPLIVEGPKGILTAAALRPKEQRVFTRLALSPGEVVPRDELLELFWHSSPVVAAERSLRTVVSSLRNSLRSLLDGKPPRLISGRFDGYRLEVEACAVDADLFAKAVRAARSIPAPGCPPGGRIAPLLSPPTDRAMAEWRRAEELYRGDLLVAFLYEDWCLTPRERLRDDFLDVLFQLARTAFEGGHPEEARRRAARMVDIDSTEERAHRLLMRCYVMLERPAEALRQFERCRVALWEELAARPSPSTVSLLHAIREGLTLQDENEETPEAAVISREALFR